MQRDEEETKEKMKTENIRYYRFSASERSIGRSADQQAAKNTELFYWLPTPMKLSSISRSFNVRSGGLP